MTQLKPSICVPKIALIGRANVGKSTLFNTLGEEKKAIVSKLAGTTRDRNYLDLSWRGNNFILIDTGGIDIVHPQDIEKDILKQADFALAEADLILFMVDAQDGLTAQDKKVAQLLKKHNQPTLLVVNKADNKRLIDSTAEFYQLNVGEPLAVSAANGVGLGDLLDVIVKKLSVIVKSGKEQITSDKSLTAIKVAIIGKPNTGKSTLVNSLVGEERRITSPLPYTTRDTQDIDLVYNHQNFTLIDTAGIRKRVKIKSRLEKFSVAQAMQSLDRADLALLVTDVTEPLSKQDKVLGEIILKNHNSVIIVANKWDRITDKESQTINKFIQYYHQFFPHLKFAPLMFLSALEKPKIKKVLDLIAEVYQERFREISNNALDKLLKKIIKQQPPPQLQGHQRPKLYQLKQLAVAPPVFEVVKDGQAELAEAYLKYIKKKLREKFGFLGTPLRIKVRRLKF